MFSLLDVIILMTVACLVGVALGARVAANTFAEQRGVRPWE